MNVLLLRLAGPMQSWGTQSRFPQRDTGLEPSKSGVLGLICAALGRPRWESVADLSQLRMGVRVDREGKMESDYQTALNVIKASGERARPWEAVVSNRFYLADADFLVGLEAKDISLLRVIDEALPRPHWPLFLGRKAFPPGKPVHLRDGLLPDRELLEALKAYPMAAAVNTGQSAQVRFVLEDPAGESVQVDQPAAPFSERQFVPRQVLTIFVPSDEIPAREEEACISHC